MRNHERYGAGEDVDTLRGEEELLEFGEKSLPKYVQNYWQDACKTMGAERINGLTDTLVAIKDGEAKQAVKLLKDNWLSDGLVMGSVATYLPEGVDVVRQVHAEVYGEGRTKENSAFLDQMERWHKEQRKKLAKEVGGAVAKANSEAYHGPTTREKFMERVHDTFGPEEARMLAYGAKEYAKECGLDFFDPYSISNGVYRFLDRGVSPPKEPVVYEDTYSYLLASPLYRQIDEPLDFLNQDDWIAYRYRKDLEIIKKTLVANNSKNLYSDYIREIDDCLANPKAKPEDGTWGYSTMQAQDIEFTHYRGLGNLFKKSKEVELRLYMCPRSDNMMELIDEFRYRSINNKQLFKFKFANRPVRADRFIIYTNYEQVNDQLDILKSIKNDRPELFEDMDDTRKNPFWGKIDGAPEGVYFGEERAYDSYSGLRAAVFEEACTKWLKEVYGEYDTGKRDGFRAIIKNEVSFNSPSDISWENAKKLEQIFREELDKANVNPDNMCFNKSAKDIYVTDEDEEE